MKFLKSLFLLSILLILAFLLFAAFAKKDYSVEKEIVIAKPKAEVFNYLKFMKNQDEFSSWSKMDPNMKTFYSGTDATVGFVGRWESEIKEVGVGEQEITAIVEGNKIDYELRFYEPFSATDKAYIATSTVNENNTKVCWVFNGHMDFPTNALLPILGIEKMIGKDLKKSLANLKETLEKQ